MSGHFTTTDVVNALARRKGKANGIHVRALAHEITGFTYVDHGTERRVRKCISALRLEGVAICGRPETGYFLAETPEELDEFCIKYLEGRAMHSLKLSSRLRKIPLPVLAGQLFLNQA